MILLLDLHERPLAPEAPRSRVFVDEIFSLFSEHPGEAWQMLGRLRRRAEMAAKNSTDNTWDGAEIGWGFGEWPATVSAADEMPEQQVVAMPEQPMDIMLMQDEFDWFVEVDGSSPRTLGHVGQVDMNDAAAGWPLLDCD